MIRKLVRQMLTAQILSSLTVSLCLMIDSIMIGRFLGEEAIAAYGLANPVLLFIGAIGSLLASGIQVVCARSLGRGSREETDAGFSSALALAAAVSVTFTAAVLLLRDPLAAVLGAGGAGALHGQTAGYLAGFSLGAPFSMGALVLVPFLQMAGESTLLIAAVLSMTVTDVALDLLNVTVFHGGMFGMGLASSVSYLVAVAVSLTYFLSRRNVFRFSRRLVTGKKLAELLKGGLPAGVSMASGVLLVFVMNRILQTAGGNAAVAAFAVVSTVGNVGGCIVTGTGGVSLTLSGIFYHEEDRAALRELIRLLCRSSAVLGLAVGAALVLAAPAAVGLFIPEAGEARTMAVLGLQLFSAGLIPCCVNAALKNLYLATGRVTLSEILSLAEGAVMPALSALILSLCFGTDGVWLYYAAGQLLTLTCLGLYIRRKTGQAPWRGDACLLPRDDFGVKPEDLMETEIRTLREVSEAAQAAERFCRQHGQSERTANRMALCIEEMAGNIVEHGFPQGKGPHHLSVRVLLKPGYWVLRFRDDCRAFDPVHYVPAEGQESLGIRLVLALAEEANYTYSLNLNNLTLRLRPDAQSGE